MKLINPRTVAALAMIATLGVGLTTSASATGGTVGTTHKNAVSTYKSEREVIMQTCQSAITAAKATFATALAAATTHDERVAAHTALTAAITAAKSTRDAALAALGPKPVKPTKPTSGGSTTTTVATSTTTTTAG